MERNFELMGTDISGIEEASRYYTRTEAEVKGYEYSNEFIMLVQSVYEQELLKKQDCRE